MDNKLLNKEYKEFIKKSDIKSPDFVQVLESRTGEISEKYGLQYAFNEILRTEVIAGVRKPKLAIYDHAFHFLGGAQKYGLTLVNALKDIFDITILSNKPISNNDFIKWYGMDFYDCELKTIKLPFFEKKGSTHLDPSLITRDIDNPFHKVSIESGNYDFFINNSMNEMVYPLSNVSVMICHFPERRPASYFYSDKYTYVVYNSKYTAGWIEKRWGFVPHKHIYPPVDMANTGKSLKKENIILSVARFEESGTKKQKEMIDAFIKLNKMYPKESKKWKLVLLGGSTDNNNYLKKLKTIVNKTTTDIEIKTNISSEELISYYKKSKIFWHLCGLDQTEPEKVEHFGMTIVEAMQNSIVPIVFNGGGQKEIVEQDISGYRVKNTVKLIDNTIKLFNNKNMLIEKGKEALKRSELYTREKFEKRVIDFFNELLSDYSIINS